MPDQSEHITKFSKWKGDQRLCFLCFLHYIYAILDNGYYGKAIEILYACIQTELEAEIHPKRQVFFFFFQSEYTMLKSQQRINHNKVLDFAFPSGVAHHHNHKVNQTVFTAFYS